ncbi:FAD/NAD(P)-binding protein [Bizionia saleffrena]|uniref:FAD/NAD(P)-binding protein n=1 Tax=Bizionia saleffrena TaxID=291189 RepID=UPI001FE269CB|nr:FAD/NAD(P)-binding protein [Bizionia saleffrena]
MSTLRLAIIGSGPTALYCLKHILDHETVLIKDFQNITIFESGNKMGVGMPYNAETTDKYNLSNISSEEIPELTQPFANWLSIQDKESLKALNITSFPIDDSKVYSRLALGAYFHSQYNEIIHRLKRAGFNIKELINSPVTDIKVNNKSVTLVSQKINYFFSKVLISTGHHWKDVDKPSTGYFATPWPISKIIPKNTEYYNFEIGILGASLSAFDVVTSLAHRHGEFSTTKEGLKYRLYEDAKGLKFILHALNGWLPHLQYEQIEPFRKIYRHTNREHILSLINDNGFLRIETFFDAVCRPALIKAFEKDKNIELQNLLSNDRFGCQQFIDTMAKNHTYIDSFKGMELELIKARDSVENDNPIHWMETLDDVMYCLNFHAELLSAEDHLFFKKEIKPFLMNVIAALPLDSAEILIALYKADVIDLIAGNVERIENLNTDKTTIEITTDKRPRQTKAYDMFINCSGNDNVELANYPFQSIVKSGIVSRAKAKFEGAHSINDLDQSIDRNHVVSIKNDLFLLTGGIEIDAAYRLLSTTGKVQPTIHNLSFTHTLGCRPYSYGLQACNATSSIVIQSWLSPEINEKSIVTPQIISKVYQNNKEL